MVKLTSVGWIEDRLRNFNRRNIPILFEAHYLARETERNLNVKLVERVVRTGRPVIEKSTFPDRICFKMYVGKTNETYEVPVKIRKDFLEVKSAWKRKGRH